MYRFFDEIESIEEIGETETIDIEVSGDHLFYANDILVHNSALDTKDHHQGHIQGGISKVNTTDNLIAIIQTEAMKAAGEYVFKMIKTRSSGGVGKQVLLKWDPIALRVLDQDGVRREKVSIKELAKQEREKPKTESSLLNLMKV
jgi:hypothetical protein